MAKSNYAAKQNARYTNSSANLVTLQKRLDDTLNDLPKAAQKNWRANLKKALNKFRKNYPHIKTLNTPDGKLDRDNFPMCKAIDIKLLEIMIDTTMQRQLDLKWILRIIETFRPYQAQPIQVYHVKENGHYGGWDGQHTAIAFYLIAESLGMDMDTVVVPVNMYDLNDRGQLRATFINNNTTSGKNRGKNPLDLIDIVQQMIYGVECDGVDDPEWVEMHEKWEILRDAGMFLTAPKFNNTEESGAISRVNEIMDASKGVVEKFAVYGKYVIANQSTASLPRSINSKEIPIIIGFLELCEVDSGVWNKLTDRDVEDLAQYCIDKFDANFDASGPFWEQAHQAVVNAWKTYNTQNHIPKELWGKEPTNSKNVPMGMNFFWHQLSHDFKSTSNIRMPTRPNFAYQIAAKDVF